MASLGRLGPIILENRCCAYGKNLTVISRSKSQQGEQSHLPSKTRPMVTAAELDMPNSNSGANANDDEVEVPTTCCMSGCANCVWIQYAELMSEKLKNSDEDVQKMIMEKVEDPNMRAFLSMELRCRNLVKS